MPQLVAQTDPAPPPFELYDTHTLTDPKSIGWQKIMEALHQSACGFLPPGTRYEIICVPKPPFRTVGWSQTAAMAREIDWRNTPAQGDGYHRIGRYTTPRAQDHRHV